jgi:hypothetical protein
MKEKLSNIFSSLLFHWKVQVYWPKAMRYFFIGIGIGLFFIQLLDIVILIKNW